MCLRCPFETAKEKKKKLAVAEEHLHLLAFSTDRKGQSKGLNKTPVCRIQKKKARPGVSGKFISKHLALFCKMMGHECKHCNYRYGWSH